MIAARHPDCTAILAALVAGITSIDLDIDRLPSPESPDFSPAAPHLPQDSCPASISAQHEYAVCVPGNFGEPGYLVLAHGRVSDNRDLWWARLGIVSEDGSRALAEFEDTGLGSEGKSGYCSYKRFWLAVADVDGDGIDEAIVPTFSCCHVGQRLILRIHHGALAPIEPAGEVHALHHLFAISTDGFILETMMVHP